MVLNNIKKNDSMLLKVFASVFIVSSNFTDNPRSQSWYKSLREPIPLFKVIIQPLFYLACGLRYVKCYHILLNFKSAGVSWSEGRGSLGDTFES